MMLLVPSPAGKHCWEPATLTSSPSALLLEPFWECGWAPLGLLSGAPSSPGLPHGCALSSPACSRYWMPVQVGEPSGQGPSHSLCPEHTGLSCSPALPVPKELPEKQPHLSLIYYQANDSNFTYFHQNHFSLINEYD